MTTIREWTTLEKEMERKETAGVLMGWSAPLKTLFTGLPAKERRFADGLYGAAAGDICGSLYDFNNFKTDKPEEIPLFEEASRFTDDTVCTVAVAEAAMTDGNYKRTLLKWGRRYPKAGYGGRFSQWLREVDPQPYGSWGNGSAMRVSPVGWKYAKMTELFASKEERSEIRKARRDTKFWFGLLQEAKRSAEVTHDNWEGIEGAQATASAVFMARLGFTKEEIKALIERDYPYDLSRRLEDIRPDYDFRVYCRSSVPEAMIAFLESHDFESAIRLAVSIGGDSDTIACITGSIAEAYYGGVPEKFKAFVRGKLPLEMQEVLGIAEEAV
jgi:ADP-ribosylglycohydrolase